jgi:hypothetical protein
VGWVKLWDDCGNMGWLRCGNVMRGCWNAGYTKKWKNTNYKVARNENGKGFAGEM